MRLWRRTVRPTLLFSEAGVMVEAYEEHAFADTSPPLVTGRYREIPPPRGAAAWAIQFVHVIGESFTTLQTFKRASFACCWRNRRAIDNPMALIDNCPTSRYHV